ncbi:MAG: lysophospholipase [Litorimonas sp.]
MDDAHTFRLASADGTALHARHWPARSAHATLVLVHGFGEHAARYLNMADTLTAHGVQVVAADLRGHGRSDGKRGVIGGYDEFRADLAALLGKARSLHEGVKGPLVLFGHSMGGGLVLDHGLHHPDPGVDGIIASAPLVALAEPPPRPLEALMRGLARLAPKLALPQPIDGTKISTLPDEQTAYVEDALTHGTLGLKTAVDMVDTGASLTRDAAQWSLPLLVYHSPQDQLTDYDASRAFCEAARGRFETFEEVAHEMHHDTSRAAVHTLILDFIDQLAGRD